MSEPRVYTIGRWRPRPGREAEFRAAWRDLARVFLSLPEPPGSGRLVQSLEDPGLYYSFGPWPSAAAVKAMREDAGAAGAIARLRELCEEATPGGYRLVEEVRGEWSPGPE